MARSEKWPDLDDVAGSVIDKFLAAPAVRRQQAPKHDGKKRTASQLSTEGVKPVARLAEIEPIDDYRSSMSSLQACRFEEPCTEMAWKSGVCRKHYRVISQRKAKARKALRRF